MKKVKSYSKIWNIQKVIYGISDFKLPFPLTIEQMGWLVLSLFFVIIFGKYPPLSWLEGALLKYFGIPIGITWFMSGKTFDGKKPIGFIRSAIMYFVRHKLTFAGNPIKLEKEKVKDTITSVRSEVVNLSYVPVNLKLIMEEKELSQDVLELVKSKIDEWSNTKAVITRKDVRFLANKLDVSALELIKKPIERSCTDVPD
ncbi:hypothetical protein M2151_001154 [Lachnospiraceae bacterium PH1-22]